MIQHFVSIQNGQSIPLHRCSLTLLSFSNSLFYAQDFSILSLLCLLIFSLKYRPEHQANLSVSSYTKILFLHLKQRDLGSGTIILYINARLWG